MRHGRKDYQGRILDMNAVARQLAEGERPTDAERYLYDLGGELPPAIPADEPVFLIRGRDVCAPAAIECYAEIARAQGAETMALQAMAWAEEVARWQEGHPDRVKVPDAPYSVDKKETSS